MIFNIVMLFILCLIGAVLILYRAYQQYNSKPFKFHISFYDNKDGLMYSTIFKGATEIEARLELENYIEKSRRIGFWQFVDVYVSFEQVATIELRLE